MQAIILAAGMGRRLGEMTSTNTKSMIKVNGRRLIDRMLYQLSQQNLSRIVIVIGYKGEELKRYILSKYNFLPIEFIENNVYDKTNNIYSLWLAKDKMREEDTLLLESDLIFEDKVLTEAINSCYKDCALVAKYQTWMDGTMVRIDDEYNIVNFIPKKAFKYQDTQYYYKTVNLYKFSKDFINDHYLPFLEAYIKVLGENEYYEQVLRVITLIDNVDIKALPITGLKWYEIDDIQDLRIAETIFASPEERLKKLQNSYGGFWRYPELLDFCYLVNPYFPKSRMIDEMKANFENLIRDYPSGMKINSMLAGKYFGIKEDFVAIGNGAAELIKSYMENIKGNVGVIYPTFEEYPNRLSKKDFVVFQPFREGFKYNTNDIIEFFSQKEINNLIIINPDNPSGNLIDKVGLNKLLDWTFSQDIQILIDESFIDFATDGDQLSLLKNDILIKYPNLTVMKSISKSYGVPGLRLGVIASSDKYKIDIIKRDVAIWNINSFAEFYLQIFSKYEKDYSRSCGKFKQERKIFRQELNKISYLKVFSSEANYFLCEIISKFTSYQLTLKLLDSFNILIKDCSGKKGFSKERQFIRIAIRNREDNKKLINALINLS